MKGLKGVSLCYRQDWDLLNNRHTAKRRPVVKRTISNRYKWRVSYASVGKICLLMRSSMENIDRDNNAFMNLFTPGIYHCYRHRLSLNKTSTVIG